MNLAHAYQHQIIPQYYKDIVRDTSNKVMHDKIFYQIIEAFKSVILYSKISQIGNNNK